MCFYGVTAQFGMKPQAGVPPQSRPKSVGFPFASILKSFIAFPSLFYPFPAIAFPMPPALQEWH